MAENNENHPKPNEQTIQATIQQLWLTYYNDTLYAKGLITECGSKSKIGPLPWNGSLKPNGRQSGDGLPLFPVNFGL